MDLVVYFMHYNIQYAIRIGVTSTYNILYDAQVNIDDVEWVKLLNRDRQQRHQVPSFVRSLPLLPTHDSFAANVKLDGWTGLHPVCLNQL